MKIVRTAITINAPPDAVWRTLVELPRYRRWNPVILRASGVVEERARLVLRIKLPGARPLTFRARVETVRAQREIRWLGRLLLPGLLDFTHSLEIESVGRGGQVEFVHSLTLRGLLAGLVFRKLEGALVIGLRAMSWNLKNSVEGRLGFRARSIERWSHDRCIEPLVKAPLCSDPLVPSRARHRQ